MRQSGVRCQQDHTEMRKPDFGMYREGSGMKMTPFESQKQVLFLLETPLWCLEHVRVLLTPLTSYRKVQDKAKLEHDPWLVTRRIRCHTPKQIKPSQVCS